MELVEFLLARIADDEEWARLYGCDDAHRGTDPNPGCRRRVVAECEAKRAIVGHYRYAPEHMEPVLLDLAAVYSDHPDYDQAWRS